MIYHDTLIGTSTHTNAVICRRIIPISLPDEFLLSELLEVDGEGTVFVNKLIVGIELSAFSHVADHIPVDLGLIGATTFGIGHAYGHVNGALDFLVKEGVARKAGNARVGSNGKFSEDPCAFVSVEG